MKPGRLRLLLPLVLFASLSSCEYLKLLCASVISQLNPDVVLRPQVAGRHGIA